MMQKTLYNFLKSDQSFHDKCIIGINFLKTYLNFSRKINKVYHNLEEQDLEVNNFLKKLSKDDLDFLDSLFESDVKKFLNKNKIQTNIIPSEKLGIHQIGFNFIYVENPDSLWTTGNATFFLPTKKNATNNLIIEIASVPDINVIFGFENEIVKEIKMHRFSEKNS